MKLGSERYPLGPSLSLHELHHLTNYLLDLQRLLPLHGHPGVYLGEFQEVADEIKEALRTLLDPGEQVPLLFCCLAGHTIQDQAYVLSDRRDRRTELVGDHGDKIPLHAVEIQETGHIFQN